MLAGWSSQRHWHEASNLPVVLEVTRILPRGGGNIQQAQGKLRYFVGRVTWA